MHIYNDCRLWHQSLSISGSIPQYDVSIYHDNEFIELVDSTECSDGWADIYRFHGVAVNCPTYVNNECRCMVEPL